MKPLLELVVPRFRQQTLMLTLLVIAIATGTAVQQTRLHMLKQQLASQRAREEILLFRDPSQPGRIGGCMAGKYVFFDGDAVIVTRTGRLHARAEGERLQVELGKRQLTCVTLTVDTSSGRTVVDDP